MRHWTRKARVLFIVNDRPDIARLVEADGVHLGQEDLPVKDARRLLGLDALIGVSTHNLDQLRQAVLDGASYVGVGPTFASGTKEFAAFPGLDFVRQAAAETSLPAFVIGGIDPQTIGAAVAAGARRVAVGQAIARADDPRAAAVVLRQAFPPDRPFRQLRCPGDRSPGIVGRKCPLPLAEEDCFMTQLLNRNLPSEPPPEDDDPFRYGWRYVRTPQPDGTVRIEEVPLRKEDLLYPEEEDFVVQKPPHSRDSIYLATALDTFYAADGSVVVLFDCRVDWGGVGGVRPLGPDVTVLFDVHEWREQGTFRIAEEGGRPVLVIEVSSPNTWVNDVGPKIDLYYRAGVQRYVIVDRGPKGEDPVQLTGYERGPDWWDAYYLTPRGV